MIPLLFQLSYTAHWEFMRMRQSSCAAISIPQAYGIRQQARSIDA